MFEYRERGKKFIERLIDLIPVDMSPGIITTFGLFFSIFAALFFAYKKLLFALLFLVFSSLSDALDGAVARKKKMQSREGAFFDSVADRYADFFIFLGIGAYLNNFLLALIALAGAFFVSYTRARAESLGKESKHVFGERAERLSILILATIFEFFFDNALFYGMVFLALIAHISAVFRAIKFRK